MTRRDTLPIALTLVALIASLWARSHVAWFGLPYLYPYDEPATVARALRMLQTGTLDPHFHRYGSLLTYVCMAIDAVVVRVLELLPPDSPAHLSSTAALVPGNTDGFAKPTSHPELYLVPRLFMATLGSATVGLAALLAHRLTTSWWAAALAAWFLAASPFHIKMSAEVQNDTAIAFFAVAAALLALQARHEGGRRALTASAALAGAAMSCKITGASTLAAPVWVAIMASDSNRERVRRLAIVVAAAVSVYTLTNPAAVLHPARWLSDLGAEADHYLVRGQDGFEVGPGLPYLRLQAGRFVQYSTAWASGLAVIGVLYMLRTRAGRLALLIPAVHALGMSAARVDFHRNLLVIYPFAAVALGHTLGSLSRRVDDRPALRRFVQGGGLALMVVLGWRTLPHAPLASRPEPRSAAIDRLVEAGGQTWTGLPVELRFHPRDARRLPNGRSASIPTLLCDEELDIVILPTAVRSARDPAHAAWLEGWLESATGEGQPFDLDGPATSFSLTERTPMPGDGRCRGLVSPEQLTLPAVWEQSAGVVSAYTSGTLELTKGPAPAPVIVRFQARGTTVGGIGPEVVIAAGDHSQPVSIGPVWAQHEVELPTTKPSPVTLSFVNDLATEAEDRNLYLREIRIVSGRPSP